MKSQEKNLCFIVGPGRSGSTLLYKVLSLHPGIGFISNYDARYPGRSLVPFAMEGMFSSTSSRLNAWFDHQGGAYYLRRPWLKKLVPTPVEGEPLLARCGLVMGEATRPEAQVAACLSARLNGLLQRKGAKVLLVKRTALNQSIPLLYGMFPRARFIYLVRDGRSVAASLMKVDWWPHVPLPWDGNRTPLELQAEGKDMTWIAARNWTAGIEYAERGLAGIPDTQIFRLRYEDFLGGAPGVLSHLLDFLDVPPSRQFDSAIDSLGLAARPEAWPRQLSEVQQRTILETQTPMLERYGYL